MNLLIVGSIALDSVITPFGETKDAIGGSAMYASYAAAHFTSPHIVGVVGEDFPNSEIQTLHRKGINTDGLRFVRGGKTFRWGGRYFDDINRRETLFTDLNVFSDFAPELPPSYRNIPNVFLANIDPDLQLNVLSQIKKPRLVVCDTMNLWIEVKHASLRKLFRKIDVLMINDEEARMLTGTTSLTKAARRLKREGIQRIIIKKGEHGALMFGPEGVFSAPALPLHAVKDPTGAGDSFAGGMIGWLSSRPLTSANWRKAIVVGTALASFCVEDFSVAGLRTLTLPQIRKRAEELRDMMRVGKI
jgi:sugar/nucleoside kinase (ribokinase family)